MSKIIKSRAVRLREKVDAMPERTPRQKLAKHVASMAHRMAPSHRRVRRENRPAWVDRMCREKFDAVR